MEKKSKKKMGRIVIEDLKPSEKISTEELRSSVGSALLRKYMVQQMSERTLARFPGLGDIFACCW